MRTRKKTIGEKLFAQTPGFLGLLFIGPALGYVWYAKTYPPHILYFAPVEILVAAGMVSLGIWGFAS